MSETIAAIEQEIIEDFELFDEWAEKYEYVIEIGRKLPAMNADYKTDSNKIKGCQSSVWMHTSFKDGRIYFEADSDSTFVKGLIALLMKVMNGQKPEEIVAAPLDFVNKTGLTTHIAQTRTNGLNAMIKQMKLYALGYQMKAQQLD
ncbi:MAG: SufE family protein [Bacteroidota bacterium]